MQSLFGYIKYEIINFDTDTTLLDNNAYKLTYITEGNVGFQGMEIWTVKENKLYHLKYVAESTKYSIYLPTIQKMIDSLYIIK